MKQCLAVLDRFGLSVPEHNPQFLCYSNSGGDLSSKIGITTVEEKIEYLEGLSKPDFYFFKLSDFMDGNSGNISYCFNPNAFLKKRLLCFADSFVGAHIDIYAYFFEEVVLLRSPFIIESMVGFLEPDYIMTSNAERYLVNVPLFSNSPWFLNYLNPGKIKSTFSNSDFNFLKILFGGKNNLEMSRWRDKKRMNISLELPHEEITLNDIRSQKDVDYIVQSAALYEKSNLSLSIKLMEIAKSFRPKGVWINCKLDEYKKRLY